jgi:UDP-N-acetylglucosamine 2-epimerase
MKKIAIITGSRGEYGYIKPVIREIEKRKDMDYGIIACNMHTLDSFGSSLSEMEKRWSNPEIPAFLKEQLKTTKQRRAAVRAITPEGFAKAFFKANQ